MRTSIFKKTDYEVINLPHPTAETIPVGQYPSETYKYAPVHHGVVYAQDGFKGSKLWCCNSPYPGYDDDWENPMVWKSDDSVYPPIQFIPYAKNPIIGKIGAVDTTSFNADPDISIINGELIVLNRESWSLPDVEVQRMTINMYKGIFTGDELTDFTAPVVMYEGYGEEWTGVQRYGNILSPSLHFDEVKQKYYMIDLISGSWNRADAPCKAIRIAESTTLTANCFDDFRQIAFHGYKIEPWHISVFEHDGKLYSIICSTIRGFNGNDSGRIYLGEFNSDLTAMYIYGRPLTDFRTYRSAAFVDENGLFVLHANSYNQNIGIGGTGYGGKDVYSTSRPFAEVLEQVRR